MTISISKRLKTVAQYVPSDSVVADIGSDHAFLPVFLVQTARAKHAIAGEVHTGPFQSAERTVREYLLTDRIKVRKGDGLDVVANEDLVDTVVIAGMGGGTIQDILNRGRRVWDGIERLVLQPMNHVDRLRSYLDQNGWTIIEETLVEEDGILYEIVVCEKGIARQLNEWQCIVGPILLAHHHPLLQKKAEEALSSIRRAIAGMEKSQEVDTTRLQEFRDLESKWQEVLSSYGKSI